MKLYLVRHGETTYNSKEVFQPTDSILSAEGRKQSDLLAKRLEGVEFYAFFSSPMLRAKETTEIINKRLRMDVVYTDCLTEVRRPSEMLGLKNADDKAEQIKKEIMKNSDDPSWHYSDEENFTEFKDRVKGFMCMLNEQEGNDVLAVAHAGVIKMMVSLMMLDDDLDQKKFERLSRFMKMKNAGVTLCEKRDDEWRMLTWSDYGHLG